MIGQRNDPWGKLHISSSSWDLVLHGDANCERLEIYDLKNNLSPPHII